MIDTHSVAMESRQPDSSRSTRLSQEAARWIGLGLVLLAPGLAGCSGGRSLGNPASTTEQATVVSGQVGSQLRLDGGAESVIVSAVIDPIESATYGSIPAGDRLVGVSVAVNNTSERPASGQGNRNALLVASDGRTYTPTFVTGSCYSFDDTAIPSLDPAPGQSASGCVLFAIPAEISMAAFRWFPNPNSQSNYGEWSNG